MNIILTGFMGTGKSSVGQELSRRLKRSFVDMDVEIEKRTGKSISRIFAEDGEFAFRQIEAQLGQALSKRENLVIATGGGALVEAVNRRRMMSSGPLFCLTCEAGEILRRLALVQDRPLLQVGDRRAEIECLLQARREAYAAIPRQIDTTDLTVDEIASRVIDEAFSILLPVRYPGGTYPIHVGPDLFKRLGALVKPHTRTGVVAVVTNPTVGALYVMPVLDALKDAGLTPFACTMPDGEQYKTLDTLNSIFTALLEQRFNRDCTLIALGGGVVGDITGFAAASYQRGVSFLQIPTTLLAQVDSSVGGKTGVNHPLGKNMIGAFHQPGCVLIDTDTLDTLDDRQLAAGLAEVIKYGLIRDAGFFGWLEANMSALKARDKQALAYAIERSCAIKAEIVAADEHESGQRALLNLGHTFGHAIETGTGYGNWLHGEAVATGMLMAADLSARHGWVSTETVQRTEQLLRLAGLPISPPDEMDESQFMKLMAIDKKVINGELRLILLKSIGKAVVTGDFKAALLSETLTSAA